MSNLDADLLEANSILKLKMDLKVSGPSNEISFIKDRSFSLFLKLSKRTSKGLLFDIVLKTWGDVFPLYNSFTLNSMELYYSHVDDLIVNFGHFLCKMAVICCHSFTE